MSGLTYGGFRILVDESLSDHVRWDFDACRSPARAERRWKRGKRNKFAREIRKHRPDIYQMGDALIMHPVVWAQLKRVTQQNISDIQRDFQRDTFGLLFGGRSS